MRDKSNMAMFHIAYGKRGWMRLMESVIAVLILASVLIVVYTNNSSSVSSSEYISNLQTKVLGEIAENASLRSEVLKDSPDIGVLNSSVRANIPINFNFQLNVCPFDLPEGCLFSGGTSEELYVKDTLISGDLQEYNPKIVRLYVWEKE